VHKGTVEAFLFIFVSGCTKSPDGDRKARQAVFKIESSRQEQALSADFDLYEKSTIKPHAEPFHGPI
jgi:hypothetical protein